MSARNKTAVLVSPATRVLEFGTKLFCVEGTLLMCKVCNVAVDHVRKQSITDHIQSKKHVSRGQKREADVQAGDVPKRQTTMEGCMMRKNASSQANEKVTMDLVKAFMSANIPLEKLDNPQLREFLTVNVKSGGNIPLANTARATYVPKVFQEHQQIVLERLRGRKVAAIVDETTDVAGRYTVNILLQPLDAFADSSNCKAMLVNTEFLTAVNSVSIAQLLVKTLNSCEVNFNDVLALVSDNAAYMKKCFKEGLSGLLPNAVHVTCWAHIISLVGEEFRAALSMTDGLVAAMKQIFSKAPGRRARYLSHLREKNCNDAKLPPSPVLTRWNTWFEAALYHAEHLEFYREFVNNEILQIGSTIQLNKVLSLLEGDSLQLLQAELEFLAVHCERLIGTLKSLESHEFRSFSIFNTVTDLLSWMRSPSFPYALQSCEMAMNNAALKLSEYVEGRLHLNML